MQQMICYFILLYFILLYFILFYFILLYFILNYNKFIIQIGRMAGWFAYENMDWFTATLVVIKLFLKYKLEEWQFALENID